MTKKKTSYKESLREIEDIIEQIENGDPDIDKLTDMVKRAATLIKDCKQNLKKTQEDLDNTLGELE
ncbi:MAG: exodeoxyribonuclease VII small subunit [Bacteroidota bacterium]